MIVGGRVGVAVGTGVALEVGNGVALAAWRGGGDAVGTRLESGVWVGILWEKPAQAVSARRQSANAR